MTPCHVKPVHAVLNRLVNPKLTEPAEQQGVRLHSGQALNHTVANSIKKKHYIQDFIEDCLDVAMKLREMRSELELHAETET